MKELSTIPNPFRNTIVSDPWRPSTTDVPEIHAKVFQTCCSELETVRTEGHSSSVLIHGEPGSGKTHLLSRLRLHCKGVEARAVDPIQPETVFVAVRLQTGPQRLWRHVRRSFVQDLLRVDGSTSQLERILLRRLGEIRQADADLLLWWEWLKQEYSGASALKRTLDELFDCLEKELQLSRDLCNVLGHLMMGYHLRDARGWLMGDALPESALNALGLAVSLDDDLEDQAQRIILDLCRLAGPKIPVVLCFDQMEALLVDPTDRTPFAVLGQMIMKLFDGTSNLLLISCVQSTFIDDFKLNRPKSVSAPAAVRMAVQPASLSPLSWEDARRLIVARMSVHSGLAGLRASRTESLWPLDEERLKQAIGTRGCTPREILAICAEMFDNAADNRGNIRTPVTEFLARTWQGRLEETSESDTAREIDNILVHGIPLLVHTAAQDWKVVDNRPYRDIDLVLEGSDGRLGFSLCNHRDLRSLWPRLKRLPALIKNRGVEKLLLVRDVRLPIGKSAVKVNQLLNELCGEGAHFVRTSHEVLAALDALRRLLSDAKSGDLSNQGQTISPETVQEWLAKNMPIALQDFLEEVIAYPGVGGRVSRTDFLDRLLELLVEHPVISVEEAAAKLDAGVQEIEQNSRANNKSVGVLNGPPVVLFRLVADELETD